LINSIKLLIVNSKKSVFKSGYQQKEGLISQKGHLSGLINKVSAFSRTISVVSKKESVFKPIYQHKEGFIRHKGHLSGLISKVYME
jgi:hypothetical protein